MTVPRSNHGALAIFTTFIVLSLFLGITTFPWFGIGKALLVSAGLIFVSFVWLCTQMRR